jgi:hypothetical protein
LGKITRLSPGGRGGGHTRLRPHEPPCLLRRPWYCLGSEDDEDVALRSGGGIRHERIEEPGNSRGGDGRRPRPGAARWRSGEGKEEKRVWGERLW